MSYTNPKMPRSKSTKVATPGSGGGLARQSPVAASPLRSNPYTGGHGVKKTKGKTVASYREKNEGAIKKGTHKMAQGGEQGGETGGLSKTNRGRQRL